MIGKLVSWPEGLLNPGEYARHPVNGWWYGMTPNGHFGCFGGHEVAEHEDGTITVSPSILVTIREGGRDVEVWHGYLVRGEWREC